MASIQCLLTGDSYAAAMMIDTGADETCFPASLAAFFNHSNEHPDVHVKKDAVQGIGGFSDAYLHSVRISLIDPVKSSKKKHVIAWSSDLDKVPFVAKFDCTHGLIGMDIIRNWSDLTFVPQKKGGVLIRITI